MRLLLFLFVLFFAGNTFAAVEVNYIDLNFGSVSAFTFSADCNEFFSEFSEGDLVDYSLWFCFSDGNCDELFSGSYLFKPDCFVGRDFNLFIYDDNVGFFSFNKLHYETEWDLKHKRFFQKVTVPVFEEDIPFMVSFLSFEEPSFLWLLVVGLLILFVSFALLRFGSKWALPLMVLSCIFIVLGILFL